MRITNRAQAARGINVMLTKDRAQTIVLQPGETSPDVKLVDPEDRQVIGMLQNRELETDDERFNKMAKEMVAPPVPASAMPYAETREAVAPEQVPEMRSTIAGKPPGGQQRG